MERKCKIAKEFRFEAAHTLPNHSGKCKKPHGHSYRCLLEVDGPIKDEDGSSEEGMVMDFGKISLAWKQIEPALDHCDLNTTIAVECGPTTAENIAGWILSRIPFLTAVTVYETTTSSARVER